MGEINKESCIKSKNIFIDRTACRGHTGGMDGFGQRLRVRAQALGLSDAEVARRTGLSEQRYSNYVRGLHEPDFATLVKIAGVLSATTDSLLLPEGDAERDQDRAALEMRLVAAARSLDVQDLKIATGQVELFAQFRRQSGLPESS